MDELNKIRKRFFTHGESRNKIAKEFHRSWDTIDRIVKMKREDLDSRGFRPNRPRQVITPKVLEAIEGYFKEEEDNLVKKKQRYTGMQIYRELKEKKIYHGSQRQMQLVVSSLRRKQGQKKSPSFLPLEFPMGSALQIDHGEADVEIQGTRIKGYLFVASVPGQVLRYCQIFPTKSGEAWGEFHEKTFQFFGGVFPRIIYDNDTVLVKKIIGNQRKQTTLSLSLEEHYQFESHFCNVASGNEKGAVENSVGYCRRRFLSGYPTFNSWKAANALLSECCRKDIQQGSHYKTHENLADLFQKTQAKLNPVPPKRKWCRWVHCRVDHCQLVTIDTHQYSVPEKFVGSTIRAAVSVDTIELFKDKEKVAVHQRQYGPGEGLQLDHYLEQLLHKPGAFSYAKVVSQNKFHPKLLEMQQRLSEKYGSKEATRQFVSILLLRRQWSQKELLLGVEKALTYGAIDYSAVETLIRQRHVSRRASEEEAPSLIPHKEVSWTFDLTPYAELCREVAL